MCSFYNGSYLFIYLFTLVYDTKPTTTKDSKKKIQKKRWNKTKSNQGNV